MSGTFETRSWDGAGRVGDLEVPSGASVRTPALLPVVDPRRLTVDPARFREFGVEALITNAYIIYGEDGLRERARKEGLHDLLNFDGVIVTDSGSFQLAEYGEIDVTTTEILRYQHEIGADVGTPVDIPTPPDADREQAERELETTTERLHRVETVDTGEMLVNAPVQGSTHVDLRERAARDAAATDLDVFPVGAVVPLLNAYRFDDVVRVTLAAKRGLPADAPVHLFGAGHPMVFALAAAAGCDLFDSAAYAIYARDDRYLTPRGTRHLEDLSAFPCACPICTDHEPADLRRLGDTERTRLLAEHNLHVSFAELRRVRQAIRGGTLLELVESRARAHPRVLDGYRALLDGAGQIEVTDPASKDTFFYLSPESARRPEVQRHRDRLERVAGNLTGDVLLVEPADPRDPPSGALGTGGVTATVAAARAGHGIAGWDQPADDPTPHTDRGVDGHTSGSAAGQSRGGSARAVAEAATRRGAPAPDAFDTVWLVRPPFGPYPGELTATYPLSAELPAAMDDAGYEAAARGVARLAVLAEGSLTVAHRDWPAGALALVPDAVTAVAVGDETADGASGDERGNGSGGDPA